MTTRNPQPRYAPPPAPLSAKHRAMIDRAVKQVIATRDATAAAVKAAQPYLDRLHIAHFCSVQTEGRLQQINGLWTDQMVINLCRGSVLSALQREGNRRFAGGQMTGTSELAFLREYAAAELAQRAKAR